MHKNGTVKIYPATIPDKEQPHNLEAEEATIGGLLIDPARIIFVKSFLKPSDFKIQRLGWIYAAMSEMDNAGAVIDMVTLSDELDRRNQLKEVGGSAYLSGLINVTPTSMHVNHYAKIVHRDSVYRQLIDTAGEISRLAFAAKDGNPDDSVKEATDLLFKISTNNIISEPKPARGYCADILDDLDSLANAQGVTGIKTSLIDLDKLTGGLQPGHFILIAARPGMGKSALALQIALQAAKNNHPALYFSLEMLGKALIQRAVSMECGINNKLIKYGPLSSEDYQAILPAIESVQKLPFFIDDKSRTIEQIRSKAMLHQNKYGLDLLVIDYIQRIHSHNVTKNTRDGELGEISRSIKQLSIDLEIPIICISSLSRQCEYRSDKRPMLSDLRESGSLEFDADEVLFLYRDDYYNSETTTPNICEMNLAKQRDGEIGQFNTYFKKTVTKFESLDTISIHA